MQMRSASGDNLRRSVGVAAWVFPLRGWITTESVENFTERASTISNGATFVINSDGGDLQSAMELGRGDSPPNNSILVLAH
jgi:hypothetical protein